MTTFNFPKDGTLSQANQGDALGNLQMTYGVDLSSEPGKIRTSYPLKNIFDEGDDAQFSSRLFALAGPAYTDAWWHAITDNYVWNNQGATDPSTGWIQDAESSTPTLTNRADMAAANGFFITGDSTGTIWYKNGAAGAWTNWWITSKGQAALNTSYYTPLRVGPQNNLYIVDNGFKVHYVPDNSSGLVNGTPKISGTDSGTLNIFNAGLRIFTLEPTSSRMWFGCYSIRDGSGAVIEWDMSTNSTSYNRRHNLPAPVIAVPIHNDVPYAVLNTGEIYRFNGTRFEFYTKFPTPSDFTGFTGTAAAQFYYTPDSFSLMHPRGWAVIDGMLHFSVNGQMPNATALTGSKQTKWFMPSGVWCLDPNVGLYCRFPVDVDVNAGNSIGAQAIKGAGALVAINKYSSKFITGFDFYTDSAGTAKAALLSSDTDRTYASRARFSPTPFTTTERQAWQMVKMLHKKLGNANDRIIVKYRLHRSESLPAHADVTWSDSDTFTSTSSTFASASVGDEVYVLLGDGAGCSAHISSMTNNSGTYTVNLDETILGISGSETGTVRVDNWRKLATISAQNVDYHEFSIPTPESSRKIELLVEMRSAAGSTIEIDLVQLTSKGV